MMIKLEKALPQTKKPKIMLIQGDTNTMLAAGLTALKLGIELGHVEAGLRSYDWRMPEEHNRRMIDHVSHYLFAPTELAKKNLLEENVWGEIYVTGNTIIDAIDMYFDKVKEAEERIQPKYDQYALVTFHRAENVDNPQTLRNFVRIQKKPHPHSLPGAPPHQKTSTRIRHVERARGPTHTAPTTPRLLRIPSPNETSHSHNDRLRRATGGSHTPQNTQARISPKNLHRETRSSDTRLRKSRRHQPTNSTSRTPKKL